MSIQIVVESNESRLQRLTQKDAILLGCPLNAFVAQTDLYTSSNGDG
jgi:hypothetical protein